MKIFISREQMFSKIPEIGYFWTKMTRGSTAHVTMQVVVDSPKSAKVNSKATD